MGSHAAPMDDAGAGGGGGGGELPGHPPSNTLELELNQQQVPSPHLYVLFLLFREYFFCARGIQAPKTCVHIVCTCDSAHSWAGHTPVRSAKLLWSPLSQGKHTTC